MYSMAITENKTIAYLQVAKKVDFNIITRKKLLTVWGQILTRHNFAIYTISNVV